MLIKSPFFQIIHTSESYWGSLNSPSSAPYRRDTPSPNPGRRFKCHRQGEAYDLPAPPASLWVTSHPRLPAPLCSSRGSRREAEAPQREPEATLDRTPSLRGSKTPVMFLVMLRISLPCFEQEDFPRCLSNRSKSFLSSCHSFCVKIQIHLRVLLSIYYMLRIQFREWSIRREKTYFSTQKTDQLPRSYILSQKYLKEWFFFL